MKISLKNPAAISAMQAGGAILKEVLESIARLVAPGISTFELDREAEKMILSAGAFPSFKGYQGFPATLCTSLNDEVVHGIPSTKRLLQKGDLLKLDCGVFFKGFHTDKALTVVVGNEPTPLQQKLMQVTKGSLELAASLLQPGIRLGLVSSSIQKYVEKAGFQVVRDLVGHGIGRELHEEPAIPNYGPASAGPVLKAGMTLAIEPMITSGTYEVLIKGWDIRTADGSLSAHFENTFWLNETGCSALT